MKNKRIAIVTAGPLLAVCLAATAHAQATWLGNTSNNWGTAANWNPAAVPEPLANIIINDTTGNALVLDTGRSITNFQFGNTSTRTSGFTIRTQTHQLEITGGLTAIGNLAGVGPSFYGNLAITTGQTWNISGQIGAHNQDRGVFIREMTDAGGAATGVGSLQLNANLTKSGSGQLVLAGVTVAGDGNFIVNEGALKLNAGVGRLLTVGGGGNITVNSTAQLFVSRNSGTMAITRPIILNDAAGMVWGGGTGSSSTVASSIAWDGTSHTINLPTNGINYTSTGAWTGNATVNRTGAAILTVSGDLSGFSGTLSLQGGTTNLTGTSAFGGSLSASGGTNAIATPIAGDVTLSGGATTLNGAEVGGSLTLSAGATLIGEVEVTGDITLNGGQFSASPLTPASLSTTGNLAIYGTTSVSLAATPPDASPFVVLRYAGDLFGGGAANLQLLGGSANYRSPVFDDTTDGVITLAVGSESRTWNGGAFWDINASANWLEGDNKFFQLDSVLFTDTMAGTVSLTGVLSPSSITVNSSLAYVFTGSAGNYLAAGSLLKTGSGTLYLNSPNTFSSGIVLNQGGIVLQNNQGLGANGNQITIAAGATLDFNGNNASRDYQAIIAGTGLGGNGAVVNNVGTQQSGLGSLTLTDDATVGGTARWDLRPINAGTGVLNLDGHTLTKTGAGEIAIVESVFVSGGTIVAGEGRLRLTRNNTGVTTGLVRVLNGAFLQFENNSSGYFGWGLAIDNATAQVTGNAFTVNSDATLANTATIQTDVNLTLTGAVSGDGALNKTGGASLILEGNASHGGGTTVNAGTLQLGVGGTTGSVPGDIANYGTVAYNRSDDISLSTEIYGTGGLLKDGAGTLTIALQQTYGGATTVNNGTLVLDAGANTLPVTSLVTLGNIAGVVLDLNGNNQEIRGLAGGGAVGGTVANSVASAVTLACRPTGADSITFAGVLDGDIRLEVLGDKTEPSFTAPRQRLAGTANTFTGGVLVDGGTLLVREDGSLGAVPAEFEADHIILQNNGTVLNEADPPFSLSIHPNRGITLGTGGGALVAGFNTTVTIGSVISGGPDAPLTIMQNNGVVVVTADNTYQGPTVLQPQGGNGIGRLQIGDGGTTGTLGAGAVTNDGLLRFNRSDAITVPNDIAGTGQVVQQGGGTTTLTGALTYSGTTTVQAGILAGNGSAASVTTVQTGATLAPGASTGPMATAALTIQTGATLAYEIDSSSLTADRITAGGDVTLAEGALLAGSDLAAAPVAITPGTKFVVIDYTGFALTGQFAGLSEGGTVMIGATPFTIAYADTNDGVNDGNYVTLTAGAAPGGYAAWALAKGLVEGPDGDDDKDSISNALEYVFGSEPKTPGASPLESSNDDDFFVLAFPRDDASETPDTTLAVQYGAGLADPGAWTTVAIGATGAGIVTVEENGPDPDWITVRIPKAGLPNLFARLKVTVTP